MGRIFKFLGTVESARQLWENPEALRKYLDRLRDLMMADPDCRMTEDEMPLAARIRAELFNSGLRGPELINALKARIISENGVSSASGNNASLQAKKLSNENTSREI